MTKHYNILDVIKDVVTGGVEFVDADKRTERRSICNSCEVRNTTLDVCTACSCFLPVKITLKEAECPLELW